MALFSICYEKVASGRILAVGSEVRFFQFLSVAAMLLFFALLSYEPTMKSIPPFFLSSSVYFVIKP